MQTNGKQTGNKRNTTIVIAACKFSYFLSTKILHIFIWTPVFIQIRTYMNTGNLKISFALERTMEIHILFALVRTLAFALALRSRKKKILFFFFSLRKKDWKRGRLKFFSFYYEESSCRVTLLRERRTF